LKRRRPSRSKRGRYLLAAAGILAVVALGLLTTAYASYSRLIDTRLSEEGERTPPLVYARTLLLHQGQAIGLPGLTDRLNDLGYAQRPTAETPGEFAVVRDAVTIMPRETASAGDVVHVSFLSGGAHIDRIELAGRTTNDTIQLDHPLLTTLMTTEGREKSHRVPLASIPTFAQRAVLAIEDQEFYSHPGVNPFRIMAAATTNIFGDNPNLVGYSTITQQLARMFFLADEFNAELTQGRRSYMRKVREGLMSLVIERRASKDAILELYLNDVYLGQRGSFAIHGVAEAARLFFGKDVSNLSLAEAALIAGVIQSPAPYSPFTNPERAVERRDAVLRAMVEEAYISPDAAERATAEPLRVVTGAVDNEAPYFVDMVSGQVARALPGVATATGRVHVFTTLDLNLQRAALDAVRDGLANVDALLARRPPGDQAQAALIAVDPRNGEILAMVGGRSYNQSQFNRVIAARRHPGSVFKPFVFLAAFEFAAEADRSDLTPASITVDAPATFAFDQQLWKPRNFDVYDGEITWRRALTMSRNLGTIRVGETIGFERVADQWRALGVGPPPQTFPSITLGAFDLSPFDVAEAYTLFTNGGRVHPLTAIQRVDTPDRQWRPDVASLTRVARADTTFLVTNMMRGVLDEGTAAGARAAGFTLDAAGKTGTTNDLRDAWFVGFTPELLTVVWVGFDNNETIGLTGTQAALPIWTSFMNAALAGRPNISFAVPDGIAFVDIDAHTGKRARPACPQVLRESFLVGTEPQEYCPLH
jgi:penicillin-binding protein 1B